ncbi:DUF397 domain-containing protein [Streptomyces winkii]|uniref:DUF397 domain-containing protein n=1 Tax=Streptomyces winkii TaxID=3051178 RepID=UPI0028D815E1|nr:DUF397 domain-containing protein [Streptomyces sp. DSM 40971]
MEAADHVAWWLRRPSRDCVEVASIPGTVHVRDSKDVDRPGLAFGARSWAEFLAYAT